MDKKIAPSKLLENSFLQKESKEPVWSTHLLILRRNLANKPFVHKCTCTEKSSTQESITQFFMSQKTDWPLFPFSFKELPLEEKQLIYESFLFLKNEEIHPESTVLIDASGTICITINNYDHLQIRILAEKDFLEEKYKALYALDENLEKKHILAFSPKLGYLSPSLTHCGTGLLMQSYLHLPALIHTQSFDCIAKMLNELPIKIIQPTKEGFSIGGDIVIVQNKYSMGISEATILSVIKRAFTLLLAEEKKCRKQIEEETPNDMKTQISKAFGVLSHSYQLESAEAQNLLSLITLGLDLKWLNTLCPEKIKTLLFNLRPGSIKKIITEKNDKENLDYTRAHLLQKIIAEVQFSHILK